MTTHHRRIPTLPKRPIHSPIAGHIHRSYPVGRQSFSRICKGEPVTLTITTDEVLPTKARANLVKVISSNGETETIPFVRIHDKILQCKTTFEYLGLHSFRAEFSLDEGVSWFSDNVPDAWVLIDPPQVDGLRLYTIIPNISGTVADWKANLKNIHEMGFNAVHLLPLTALDTSESPYSAKDFFDIDHSYLQQDSKKSGHTQLEEFIDEAKKLNIKLCFDLVLNHVGVNSNMVQNAPNWIVPDPNQCDGFKRARYWNGQEWLNWNDLILINYEHPSEAIRTEIWDYMIEYSLFWAKYASDTGGFVRFDNLHSSNPEFIIALTKALHSEYPNVGILAEYFADETTLLHSGPKWGLNLNLATPWDYKFVPRLREYLNYIHRVSRHIRYYMPVTSHDSGTPAQEFGSIESTVPRYIAAALLGTGATGIIQGVEYGATERINFIGRKPKMSFPEEPMFRPFIKQVNKILVDYKAFRYGENCRFVDNGHDAIIAAFRRDPEKKTLGFLVICNFDIYGTQSISINLDPYLETEGSFQACELLSEQTQTFEQPYLEFSLKPCEAKVFKFLRK